MSRTSFHQTGGPAEVEPRIGDCDECPICLDTIDHAAGDASYCRLGCGNFVHGRCLRIWADECDNGAAHAPRSPPCLAVFGFCPPWRLRVDSSSHISGWVFNPMV